MVMVATPKARLNKDTYDIADEPLFPNDGLSIDERIAAAVLAATLASSIGKAKRTSQRTITTPLKRTRSYA
jgi:hypothetical protein